MLDWSHKRCNNTTAASHKTDEQGHMRRTVLFWRAAKALFEVAPLPYACLVAQQLQEAQDCGTVVHCKHCPWPPPRPLLSDTSFL